MSRNAESGFSIEVVQSWKGQVLDTELVSLERARRITIGEVGRFLLPIGESVDVLVIDEGRATLSVPANASAIVEEGESSREIDASSADRTFVVGPHTVTEITIADMTFLVRPVAKEQAKFAGAGFDLGSLRWIGAAFAFHVAILGMFFFTPPDASALSSDLDGASTRYIQVHLDAAELTPPPPVPSASGATGSSSAPSASDSGNDAPSPAVAGGPGRPHVRAPLTVRGPSTPQDVAAFGTFQLLAQAFASNDGELSPFSIGNLHEGPGGPGDALVPGGPGTFGPGGFDMHGPGVGTCRGEHCGDGTIDQGGLDTHGGFDHPGPDITGDPRTHVPTITMCASSDPSCGRTVGGLTREQIRAVIARHRPEVRSCYEQALIGRPQLEGRVTVGFQIAQDGHVATSSATGMAGVDTCIATAVHRWQFPTSSSPSIVSYPFTLESTSSAPSQ